MHHLIAIEWSCGCNSSCAKAPTIAYVSAQPALCAGIYILRIQELFLANLALIMAIITTSIQDTHTHERLVCPSFPISPPFRLGTRCLALLMPWKALRVFSHVKNLACWAGQEREAWWVVRGISPIAGEKILTVNLFLSFHLAHRLSWFASFMPPYLTNRQFSVRQL